MKDIIRDLKLTDLEKAERDCTIMIMCKAKRIMDWMDNSCDKEMYDVVKSIYSTIQRYVIVNRCDDIDNKIFGMLWPSIKYIENYYNNNALKYEPEETEDQIRMKEIKGELFDVMCKVQTMQQDGWKFGHNTNRTMLYNGFNFAAEGYLNILNNGEILDEDICNKIKQMCKSVNIEFNKFWNIMKK